INGGSLSYVAGNGTSKVRLRNGNTLSGSIGSAQSLVVEQGCSFNSSATASASFTNAGSILLTGTGCGYYSDLLLVANTLTNTGTITVEEGTGGATGERKIEGNLVNDRLLSVHAPTNLKVTGAFTQGETGTLDTQIASISSYGSITAGGAATLAGSLSIEPIEAFKGAKGNRFATISAASRSSAFQHVLGGTISPDLYYFPIYTATGATLEVLEGEPPEKAPTVVTKPTISGHAQQSQTLVASAGTWAHEPVEYTYQWLRCEESGAGCKAIAGATGQDYLLQGTDAAHKITVQVLAYNAAGESLPAEPSSPTAVVTGLALHAAAGEDVSGIEGASVTLDGYGSTPASEISKYRWRFGDGSEQEGAGDAVLHHTYSSAGKYTASLTVFRGGEESTASTLVTIAAKPKPAEGAQITVQGSGNAPINGATVLYVGSGGTRVESVTGASGEAVLKGLPEGTDTVYVYKSGLRPAEASVAINSEGEGSKTVTLESGEIASAVLKSHELNYEEIVKAGINPSDPANQNVYEFVIKLAFIESPTPPVEVHGYVNSGGSFVGSYGASGGGGGGWSCSAGGCESGGGGGGGERIVAQPEVVEGHPLIQWLILHGKAAVLKQFFEVSMIVQNLSPEPFELTKGTATLNLPAGLSLAPTAQLQALSEEVPAIPGGGSDTTNWIIRGDEPGEYNVSANYKATLEPFAAPVEVLAALANPLKVWGKEALSLKVKADEGKLYPGDPYHVYVGITNKANVPIYNVALSIDESPHEHFIFQPQQQFSELLGELKPEQTIFVKYPYILVPDGESQSIFNPALSSATFDGEEEHPGENIEAVPPPTLYPLQAKTDTPGLVHLQWEAVPGAEGYEVFSTPTLDTPFGTEPDSVLESPESPSEVKLLPASATKAYLKSNGTSLYYALSAIIAGRPTLASPVVQGAAQLAPEYGRCVKVEKGKGKYGSSKCTTLGGKAEYEWTAGAAKAGVKLTGAASKLETVGHATVSCKALSGAGSHATSKAIEGLALTFTGCEAAGKACNSSGAGAGEVRSSTLTADLEWEHEASKKVDLDIFRIGGSTLLSFECAGKSYEVKGSALVPLKTGKMTAAESLKYKASKGKQEPSEYETPEATKVTDFLETSIAAGAFEQTGLTATLTLTSEERLEVNTAL
ncbi:MAG: PKD domain-containing protein, partial [Solirubrobacteraceae bacterium]